MTHLEEPENCGYMNMRSAAAAAAANAIAVSQQPPQAVHQRGLR
jgi:hypothetical protein